MSKHKEDIQPLEYPEMAGQSSEKGCPFNVFHLYYIPYAIKK